MKNRNIYIKETLDYDDMAYFIKEGLRDEEVELNIDIILKILNLETEYIIELSQNKTKI